MVVSPQRLTRWPSYVRDRHAAITYTTPGTLPQEAAVESRLAPVGEFGRHRQSVAVDVPNAPINCTATGSLDGADGSLVYTRPGRSPCWVGTTPAVFET
ncbi:hypothetical protein DKM27_03495 [Mycobacterium tuberculosis variant bovis]|nr:hypothetical protein DKM27_03495 [Mycobacterium tuberculosis variant bovis]